MSKKAQTTGLPKRQKKKRDVEGVEAPSGLMERLIGTYGTRAERDARVQKLIFQATAILLGAILLIIVGIFVYDQFIVPNQAIAEVNGETITVEEFSKRFRFEQAQLSQQVNNTIAQADSLGVDINELFRSEPYSTWLAELNNPDQLGFRVVNDMVDDVLIQQQAESLNISVNDEQVQEQVNNYFGFDPTAVALIGQDPTETPTPTITPTPFVSPTPTLEPTATVEAPPTETPEISPTPTNTPFPTLAPTSTLSAEEVRENFETAQDNFREAITDVANISNDDIDRFFTRTALVDAVRDQISEVEDMVLFANVRHILVPTEAEANEIIEALNNGETFANLARASSLDEGSALQGGELGWQPLSQFVTEFSEAIASAEIGEIVGPVQSDFGYHIIQVRAIEEREGTDSQISLVKQRRFDAWLEEIHDAESTDIQIFDTWLDHVR